MAKQVEELGIGVVINPSNIEQSIERILKACENYENILKNIEKYQNQFVWSQEKEEEFLKIMEL